MKLNVMERINLAGILPAEGNLVIFRILTDLKKALAFTEKEMKKFEIVQKDVPDADGKMSNRIFWKKSEDVEIPIGEQATIIIQAALKKVDAEDKVNENNFSLFVKFPFEEEEVKK